MTERPIIFSGPMVRAILAGNKTQTRRIVNPQPIVDKHRPQGYSEDAVQWHAGAPLIRIGHEVGYIHTGDNAARRIMEKCSPYLHGDRLWVRETFCLGWPLGRGTYTALPIAGVEPKVFYRADGEDPPDKPQRPWTPAIFASRKRARIVLQITDVRVERLQEIGDQDAKSEGIQHDGHNLYHHGTSSDAALTPRGAFHLLWDSINGKRASWKSNPFVWVVTFRRTDS